MASGKVKWFDNKKGFGFIAQDSGQDVFVHHTSIMGSGYKTLNEGEPVTFEAIPSDKGLKAQNVQRAEGTTSGEIVCVLARRSADTGALALLVAALTGHPLEGAAVMALFALGTSVSLMAGPWLWLRLGGRGAGDWGVRLAGLVLAVTSAWALWMAFAHNSAPWCAVPV